jgi:hypothetical protein
LQQSQRPTPELHCRYIFLFSVPFFSCCNFCKRNREEKQKLI